MTRGKFNTLTPLGKNTPIIMPQTPQVTMANQGKRLCTPRIVVKTEPTMVSTAVPNKTSFPSKGPCGRPHKMPTACQALEVEGLREGEYVFQNEDRTI